MKDILIIVNPASGGGRTGRRWAEVESRIKAAGIDFDVATTSRPLEATEIARRAVREGRPVVAAAGGDGTLNEVVNGFFEAGEPIPTATALGLVPLGSGGDFRRTFDIPLDPVSAARLLATGSRRRIDAGQARFQGFDGSEQLRHFINIADPGIGGAVVDRVNRSSKLLGADATFMLASLVSLLTWRNKPMHVLADGMERDVVAQQVVIANCRYYGCGMKMAPSADPADGLFDVIVVGDVGAAENLRGLSKIKAGTHLDQGNPKLELLRARRVEVTSPVTVAIDMDGELPGMLPALFEVVPGAIQLLAP